MHTPCAFTNQTIDCTWHSAIVHGENRAEPDLQPEEITYNEVEHLIQRDRFKQLRYRFQHSGWMLPATYEDYPEDGNGKATKPSHRNIQPNFWRASIQDRDGVNSDAEVEAFEYQQVHEWFYDFTDYDSGGAAKSDPGVGCLVGSRATKPVDVVKGRLDGHEVRVTRGIGSTLKRGVSGVQQRCDPFPLKQTDAAYPHQRWLSKTATLAMDLTCSVGRYIGVCKTQIFSGRL